MDSREEWLARTFVELADTLVADFDVIEFMSMLVDRCAELLVSAEVGIALAATRGELRVVASSTERMRAVELIEFQNDEGPCRDCLRSGEPVLNARLDDSRARWPQFTAGAREAGFEMVHALPLRLRSDVIGAMNIFSTVLRELSAQDVNLTQALADAATIGILQERAIKHGTDLAGQLQSALNSRIVIEQAKGVVAERRHVGMDEAFALLRGHARSNGIPLSDVARAIIHRSLAPAELQDNTRAARHERESKRTT
ncbi:MAG TPA: GAF and ANTAR domain-containing protein [Acidimicrobiales bacterium]|nr:GAF and ANTAR domain-containing protein [Acidimicrobiales bacterium]